MIRGIGFKNNTRGGLYERVDKPDTLFIPLMEHEFIDEIDIVAYYPLNGDAEDKVNSKHGTNVGVTFNKGLFPSGHFDGLSHVQLPNEVGWNDTQTVCFWAKAEDFALTGSKNIYSKGVDGISNGWGFKLSMSINTFFARLVQLSPTAQWDINSPNTFNFMDDEPHHFAFVYNNATDSGKMYIDGILVTESVKAGNLLRGTTHVFIGATVTSSNVMTGHFTGDIAEFAIIKKELLSIEIQSLATIKTF